MDFAAPPAVIDPAPAHRPWCVRLHRCLAALEQAVVEGLRRDHGWTIQPDWLVWLPGVVAGFNLACAIAGEAGDGVLTATPGVSAFPYRPGQHRPRAAARRTGAGRRPWQWDWDALGAACAHDPAAAAGSPHNPVGRVFDETELRRLADFAARHDLLVCSDEIHCGLVLDADRIAPPSPRSTRLSRGARSP